MGIQGLLPFLKEASEAIHIRKYKGYTVGVDTYCWIHRGAVACATQLAKGDPCDQYVRYCVKYVNMLRSLDIKPVLVFDGRNLPAKAGVEESRRERRENYNRKGRQFLREGKASEARDCFVKSINVTPEMALDVMKAVRSLGVDCIVSPYEADAQLAYLEKNGIVQAVVTEDSDLIAFGCKKVIVKLDLAGNCLEIDSSNLNKAMKIGEKFTPDKFRYMCIVAGCDYLASLPGIGIGKSRKLFHLTINPDITQVIKRMNITLKMKTTVTQEYVDGFMQANNTFLYQLAFDPRKKRLQPLTPYPPEIEPSTLTYAGRYVDADKAYQMALGNLNFNNMARMCDFDPEITKLYDRTKTPRHLLSIWHEDYEPGPGFGCQVPCPIQREPTKGKEITVEMKQKMIQRKREREEAEEPSPLPDTELSSMYTSQRPAHQHEQCENNEEQLIAPRMKEEPVKIIKETPEKSPEETKPARRNRFATRHQAKKRVDILNNSREVVTSRFFQSKPKGPDQKQVVVKRECEEHEEEKENKLNTSGLLEGISSIEEEQERQFRPDSDSVDTLEGTEDLEKEDEKNSSRLNYQQQKDGAEQRFLIEDKSQTDGDSILIEKKTHASKSLNALQRFQRAGSGPKMLRQDGMASSATVSGPKRCSTPEDSAGCLSGYKQESQESVIEISSSQDSVISVKDSCSQSSLSSSQRQGTPRPSSAFSWSRKKELQTAASQSNPAGGIQSKLVGTSQNKPGSLSSFAFQPKRNQVKGFQRNSSFTATAPEEVSQSLPSFMETDSQNGTFNRSDSCDTYASLSQESGKFPPSSYITGSMDMAGIGGVENDLQDSGSKVIVVDSQSSSHSTASVDTSSIDLSSSSQNSKENLSQWRDKPLPSLPSLPQPPPSLQDAPSPLHGTRAGLSRKRKFSQVSKDTATNSQSSSPDTDALSLNPSQSSTSSSSQSSCHSVPDNDSSTSHVHSKLFSAIDEHRTDSNSQQSLKSQEKLESRDSKRQFMGNSSSKYFCLDNRETPLGRRREESVHDGGSVAGSENTPPRGSRLPVSPSKGSNRNGKLLVDRNQGPETGSLAADSPVQKKPSALLGRCKTVGLSKKRRPSSKQTPTSTQKGQTSLLAFMTKAKPKPDSPHDITDLTPETEGSLLSRQELLTSKRNIFN